MQHCTIGSEQTDFIPPALHKIPQRFNKHPVFLAVASGAITQLEPPATTVGQMKWEKNYHPYVLMPKGCGEKTGMP